MGIVRELFAKAPYLYVADQGGGLRIIDISEPLEPKEIGYSEMARHSRDVVVLGDYAYVAAGWPGLAILDVSDPTAPMCDHCCLVNRSANPPSHYDTFEAVNALAIPPPP
jgi:hypothetical protein